MLAHNAYLFPSSALFYRATKKNPPRDPLKLWEGVYPIPCDVLENLMSTSQLQPKLDEKEPEAATGSNTKNQIKVNQNWGRDSEDWEVARDERLKKDKNMGAQELGAGDNAIVARSCLLFDHFLQSHTIFSY